jgi:hypothetical protein
VDFSIRVGSWETTGVPSGGFTLSRFSSSVIPSDHFSTKKNSQIDPSANIPQSTLKKARVGWVFKCQNTYICALFSSVSDLMCIMKLSCSYQLKAFSSIP